MVRISHELEKRSISYERIDSAYQGSIQEQCRTDKGQTENRASHTASSPIHNSAIDNDIHDHH